MSERVKILGEASRRVGNPLVLCRMISLRARQWMSSDTRWDAREAITQALRELAAEFLDFQLPGGLSWPRRDETERGEHTQEVQPVQIHSPAKEAGVEASAR